MKNRATVLGLLLVPALVLAACSEVGDGALPRLPVGPAASAGDAATTAGMAAPEARDLSFPVSRIEYRLGGTLRELARSAPAYRLAAGPTSRSRVARLAEALGLAGEVEEVEGGGWEVADGDRSLLVQPVAGLPWSFGDKSGTVSSGCAVAEGPAAAGDASPAAGATAPETKVAPVPPVVEPVPPVVDPVPPDRAPADRVPECTPPEPPADLPSRPDALRLARELFERAGVDLDGARGEVSDDYWQGRVVTLRPVLGGVQVIGMEHTATIGSGGAVAFATGWLGSPEELGDYPLAGVAEGFERLKASAVVPAGDGTPRPLGGAEPAIAPADPRIAPGEPAPGTTPTEPAPEPQPLVLEVTGADLVLVMVWGRCGTDPAHLVPSYRFTLADGGVAGPVPAPEERRLEQPDQAESSDEPCPGDGRPGRETPAVDLPATTPGASGGGSSSGSSGSSGGAPTPPSEPNSRP